MYSPKIKQFLITLLVVSLLNVIIGCNQSPTRDANSTIPATVESTGKSTRSIATSNSIINTEVGPIDIIGNKFDPLNNTTTISFESLNNLKDGPKTLVLARDNSFPLDIGVRANLYDQRGKNIYNIAFAFDTSGLPNSRITQYTDSDYFEYRLKKSRDSYQIDIIINGESASLSFTESDLNPILDGLRPIESLLELPSNSASFADFNNNTPFSQLPATPSLDNNPDGYQILAIMASSEFQNWYNGLLGHADGASKSDLFDEICGLASACAGLSCLIAPLAALCPICSAVVLFCVLTKIIIRIWEMWEESL